MSNEPTSDEAGGAARRPLRTRGSRWAGRLSAGLLRAGFRPNQISVLSVVFASGAAVCYGCIASGVGPAAVWWLLGAVGIQLRLLCNLMDGMLAVEGGLRTPDGDLYNEFPDRISDVLILVSIGYAAGGEVAPTLGWICAVGALMTAAVRLHGASLTGRHDFRGPMAKPQRMALATVASLLMAVVVAMEWKIRPLPPILGAMAAGIAFTVVRRLIALSRELRRGDSA